MGISPLNPQHSYYSHWIPSPAVKNVAIIELVQKRLEGDIITMDKTKTDQDIL
jgi:hypothetical protein